MGTKVVHKVAVMKATTATLLVPCTLFVHETESCTPYACQCLNDILRAVEVIIVFHLLAQYGKIIEVTTTACSIDFF